MPFDLYMIGNLIRKTSRFFLTYRLFIQWYMDF